MLSKTLPKVFEACTMHNTRLKCPHTGALGRLGHIFKVLIECRMLSKLNFQKLILDKCERATYLRGSVIATARNFRLQRKRRASSQEILKNSAPMPSNP